MIGFHALLPPVLTVIVLIILLAHFVWQEWRRQARFRVPRVIAEFMMMIALAGLILRPTYQALTSAEILLLTPGYTTAVVDSLIKSNPGLRVQTLPDAAPYKKSIPMNSYHDISDVSDHIRHIVGDGLPPYSLELINGVSYNFYPAPLPSGITSLFLPDGIQYRTQQITGTFNNTSGKKTIFLNNPGGREDSAVIDKTGNHPFALEFTPRQHGNLLYSLVIADSLGEQISEQVPMHVEAPMPLDILVVQGYPTFETQHLKNFLSQKHHKLALRYQVSQQAFRYEYANRPAIPLRIFTKPMLEEFDLLILSDDALQKLTPAEKHVIKASVDTGLGLLILTPSKAAGFLPELKSVTKDTTVLRMPAATFNLPVATVRVTSTSGLQPITQNASGVLSGYTTPGKGKIGFQFLQETYRLALSGDSMSYSALWTPLVEGIAKQRTGPSSIYIKNQFPYYTDEPIHVDLVSVDENPQLWVDSIQLPLQEDVLIDDVWHTTLWADAPGWHRLYTADGAALSFYVPDENDWLTLSIANQMKATALVKKEGRKSTEIKTTTTEIPMFYFFSGFLLSAGFLWLAPKF